MFTKHVSPQLAAYVDGQMSPPELRQAETHLKQCANCRLEHEQIKWSMEIIENLPLVQAPAGIWAAIEAGREREVPSVLPGILWWRWAAAATVAVLLIAGYVLRPKPARWIVTGLAATSAGPGDWIETGTSSRASMKVGEIGSVEIAPNTRLRILSTRQEEQRIALTRGEIRAKITAPPRLFFVDTASAVAADLGCEFTLHTTDDGTGLLEVSKGWVSFEWNGRESLVPAGASCRTRPKAGPGMPYFDDASERFRIATENRDVATMLAEARVRDTLTLWHLLQRVELPERERVFDRMAALTPLPPGVSRDLTLKLDKETLKHWKEELAWTW